MNEEIRSMAALATFRHLYDEGKRDIYQILSKFIEAIIITEKIYSFGWIEMSGKLKICYGFNIPDYVVKTAIKKLEYIEQENRVYIVKKKEFDYDSVSEYYDSVVADNNKMTHELCSYIEEKRGRLSDQQKDEVIKDFCNLLLENTSRNGYSDIISAFILKQEKTDKGKQIRLIKEGAILYAGINYNSNVSDRSAWKEDINIYVENEVLFHLAGYNGEVFERIAKDLMALISEMNAKKGRKVIHVRYFPEVEKEINDFFSKAQQIVRGQALIAPDAIAMKKIVEGCDTESDVITKKVEFKKLIKQYGIIQAKEYDYYNERNHQYNLENMDLAERYSITEDKRRYINHLNYISILRKGKKVTDLKKCEHLVLTNTRKMLQMSLDLSDGNPPYAINIGTLTNRLWYDLNKGFGAQDFPLSLDILTQARILLSSNLLNKIERQYAKVKKEYENKEDRKDDLKDTIIQIREEAKCPEDITSTNVDSILDSISEEEITNFQNEKEKLQSDLQQKRSEVHDLSTEIFNKKAQIEERNKVILTLLENLKKDLEECLEKKKRADSQIDKALKRFKAMEGVKIGVILLICVCLYYNIPERHTNIMLTIVPIVPSILIYIGFVIKNKTLNYMDIYRVREEKYKIKVTKKIYAKMNVDDEKINHLQSTIRNNEKLMLG